MGVKDLGGRGDGMERKIGCERVGGGKGLGGRREDGLKDCMRERESGRRIGWKREEWRWKEEWEWQEKTEEVSIKVAAEVWNEAGEVSEEREEGVKNGWNGRLE